MGVYSSRKSRSGAAAEEPDRSRFSDWRGLNLSPSYAPTPLFEDLEAASSIQRLLDRAADRGSLARSGDAAEPTLFCLHFAQRSRGIPRISLVLFHQRAVAPVSEPALSARL